jgi:hypothetical protein
MSPSLYTSSYQSGRPNVKVGTCDYILSPDSFRFHLMTSAGSFDCSRDSMSDQVQRLGTRLNLRRHAAIQMRCPRRLPLDTRAYQRLAI